MQDEKSRQNSVTPTKESAAQDATSKETVADLKKSDEASGTASGETSAESSSTPSPDGQFEGPRDGAGPGDETGPM